MAEQRKADSSVRARANDSQIMPRLKIDIPMPPGAAVPAKAPQPQPVSPAQPSQPAAARPS